MSIKIEINNTIITIDSVAEATELLNSLNNINNTNNNYNYVVTESNAISKVKNDHTITLIHDIRNEKYYYCIDTGAIVIDRSEYNCLLNDFSRNSGYFNTYYTNDISDKYKLGIPCNRYFVTVFKFTDNHYAGRGKYIIMQDTKENKYYLIAQNNKLMHTTKIIYDEYINLIFKGELLLLRQFYTDNIPTYESV